jgi:hypothetical protein
MHAISKVLMVGALPAAILAGSIHGPAAHAESPQQAPPALQAASYRFDTTKRAFTAGGGAQAPKVVQTLKGQATDFQILAAPGSKARALAGTGAADAVNPSARSTWVSNSRYIDLSWASVGKDTQYQVYRDGKPIGTTAGTSIRDTQVRPGTASTYEVSTTSAAPRSEWTPTERAEVARGGPAPTNGHTWSMNVQVPASSKTADLRQAAAQADAQARKYYKTRISYRTFIRQKWVKVPSWATCTYKKGYKYKGDNRGFRKSAKGTARTVLSAVMTWGKNGKVKWKAAIGTTHVYKNNGQHKASKRASKKNMKFRVMADGRTKREVRGITDAENPFCSQVPISAYYNLRVAQNGDYYVSGRHKQMPDHEMYLAGYTSKTKKRVTAVHLRKAAGPLCLFKPACEKATIGSYGGY